MEKYSEFRDEFLKELSNKYQNCKFSFKLVNISVDVSVFFVLSKSSILENNNLWQQISEEIALKYQPKLETVYDLELVDNLVLDSDYIAAQNLNSSLASTFLMEQKYSRVSAKAVNQYWYKVN